MKPRKWRADIAALCALTLILALALASPALRPASAPETVASATITPTATSTQLPNFLPVLMALPTDTVPPPPGRFKIISLSASANPEVLVIQNQGGSALDLAGLFVMNRDSRERYQFVSSRVLAPGATLSLETNSQSMSIFPNVQQWTSLEVWPDSGGTAVLTYDRVNWIDEYCYGSACP